ncbi:MAG: diversity-generating retroelement protein Avd [Planctomycetaceae bacterium]
MAKEGEDLPVIQACYDFTVWLVPKIGKLPRDLRFTLGERIESLALHLLEGLIRARYEADRGVILDQVNVDLEVLRYLIRVAYDLKALPIKAYGDAAKQLMDIGVQVGGWRKLTARKGSV